MQNKMTELERALRQQDPELFSHYACVAAEARRLLPRAYATFATYTDHDMPHSHAVIAYVGQLLTADVRSSLNGSEMFVLLAGATLHDIGMVARGSADADAARDTHEIAGADRIRNSPETHGIPSQYAVAVAEVVRHHRNSDIAQRVQPCAVAKDQVRLPLLCALVRAADELHVAADRAPSVLSDTLDLPAESLEHFALCQLVSGVAVTTEVGGPQILLTASAATGKQEAAVERLVDKINGELASLHPIFAENGLPEYAVRSQLNRTDLIARRVLLALCGSEEPVTEGQLADALGEEEWDTGEACRVLSVRGLAVESAGDPRTWAVATGAKADLSPFQGVAALFLREPDDDGLLFMATAYVRRQVEHAVMPWLREQFSAFYPAIEQETRIAVLCASPAALEMALFSQHPGRQPSATSRRPILDALLLVGLMADVYGRPEVCDRLDVGRAVGELGRHVARRVRDFARLIARAWEDRDVPVEEMMERVWPSDRAAVPDLPSPVRGTISLSFPAEPRFLSFPHLLHAAIEEEVELEIAKPQLRSFGLEFSDPRLLPAGFAGEDVQHVVCRPKHGRCRLPTPQVPARAEIDEAEHIVRVRINTRRAFDSPLHPLRVETRQGDETTRFEFRVSRAPASSAGMLQLVTYWRAVRQGGAWAAEFLKDDGAEVVGAGHIDGGGPRELLDLDSDVLGAFSALAEVERCLGRPIPPPLLGLTQEQIGRLGGLAPSIQVRNAMELEAIVREVACLARQDSTVVRVSCSDAAGTTVSDWVPVVVPGHIHLDLVLHDGSPKRVSTEDLVANKGAYWQYVSGLHAADIVEQFVLALESRQIWVPPQLGDESPGLPRTQVELRMDAGEDVCWGRQSVLHLHVQPVTEDVRAVCIAGQQMMTGDPEEAEATLTALIVRRPFLGEAHFALACALDQQKRCDEALASLGHALQAPEALDRLGQLRALALRAVMLVRSGRAEDAIASCEELLSRADDDDRPNLVRNVVAPACGAAEDPAVQFVLGELLERVGESILAAEQRALFLSAEDPRYASLREAVAASHLEGQNAGLDPPEAASD